MKLHELIDSPKEYWMVRDNDRAFRAQVDIGERRLEYRMDKHPGPGEKWNFTFVELDDKHDDGETYKLTGGGGALAVFATAKKFIMDFLKKHKAQAIFFEADKEDGGRASLYAKFVKKWVPAGYKVRGNHDDKYTDRYVYEIEE